MRTDRTIRKIFRCWSSRSWPDRADHVAASRLRGGSSELHGGFDEFLRLAGSSFITACINWRFNCQLSDSQNGFRAVRTSVLRQLDLRENTTTIEQEMTIKTLQAGVADGGSAEPRAPPHARRVAHPRVARRAPLRLFARAGICSSDRRVRLGGRAHGEHSRHLGWARFRRRAAAGRRGSALRSTRSV